MTIPLPGMPTGAAGVPPPIRYESDGLKILREGGIPLWTISCGCNEYSGIRAAVPTATFLLENMNQNEEKDEEKEEEEEGKADEKEVGETKASGGSVGSTKYVDPSEIVEPPPAGYGTLERKATNESPLDLIQTYLPSANPSVLNALHSVGVIIRHRLRSMDWLWGSNTISLPEFAFQRSDITPKALERLKSHPWPDLPTREIDEKTGQPLMDDPRLLPELPTTLELFIRSQTRQHKEAAKISHSHCEKWLDNIFADAYGISVDNYADELSAFEKRLEEARKKVVVSKMKVPSSPKGIEIPAILRPMLQRPETCVFFLSLFGILLVLHVLSLI